MGERVREDRGDIAAMAAGVERILLMIGGGECDGVRHEAGDFGLRVGIGGKSKAEIE